MTITNIMLEAFMQLATSRQQVLADNVARANNPGAIAKDISMPQNFGDLLKATSMNAQLNVNVTNSTHLTGSKPSTRFKTKLDKSGKLKPNGNNIDLADQATKAADNQLMFDTALKAYKSSSGLTKIALGKHGK